MYLLPIPYLYVQKINNNLRKNNIIYVLLFI